MLMSVEAKSELCGVLDRILFITHNKGVGLKAITGKEDGTNRVVFTPEQLNEIGNMCRDVLSKLS